MTTLREAAQQALDDLRDLHKNHNITYAGTISRLAAALAQEQANPPGCDHCNHPLYAATKCRVCGRVTEQAEPVEPVAWRWGYRSVTTGEMDWRGYVEIAAHPNLRSPEIIMEPLYTAPPQRKPLSADETMALANETAGANWGDEAHLQRFRAAVERAHGITDPQVEDRLARHGIPMPGDPK